MFDSAHEELAGGALAAAHHELHWSIPDPVRTGQDAAFDRVVTDLTERISRVAHVRIPNLNDPSPEDPMQDDHRRSDLSVDQQLALRTAASTLAREFDGVFGSETIERFLHSSYDEFASRAAVTNYLPLLAERFARQRLRALAKVGGKHASGVPVVLFLCTHNAGRSQMALGFFTHLAEDRAAAWSGGSDPASTINPSAVVAMQERGIDISGEYPKPWTDEIVRAADVVVTMGCGDACPVFPGRRYEHWGLRIPAASTWMTCAQSVTRSNAGSASCSPSSACRYELDADVPKTGPV